MDDVKQAGREAADEAKKAWRARDGEDLGDKVGNLGDDIRRTAANAGDDLREGVRDVEDRARHADDRDGVDTHTADRPR